MGVVIETARMRVQDRDGPGASLKLAVILCERLDALPTAARHQGVERALMAPCQGPELFGQREGQQEILGGQLFFELTFQPLLTLMMLAVWAVAVPAGVRHKERVVTFGALCLHHGAR